MKKCFALSGLFLTLALDWAALHDILKGEQDVRLEWSFVLVSTLLLAVVISKWLNYRKEARS